MTTQPRIHITGASGSGVSTLGRALSRHFNIPLMDVDDYYWIKTDPPFTTKREPSERVRLIEREQSQYKAWVLAGSCMGWGDALMKEIDHIVFLRTPMDVRLQRLEQREAEEFGARILQGGDMYEGHQAFRDWAAQYDDEGFEGRSLARHELWLSQQSTSIIRLNGTEPVQSLVRAVVARLVNTALRDMDSIFFNLYSAYFLISEWRSLPGQARRKARGTRAPCQDGSGRRQMFARPIC